MNGNSCLNKIRETMQTPITGVGMRRWLREHFPKTYEMHRKSHVFLKHLLRQ